jgi:hypothetical protein
MLRPFYPPVKTLCQLYRRQSEHQCQSAQVQKISTPSGFKPEASSYNDDTVWPMVSLQLILKASGLLVWCS